MRKKIFTIGYSGFSLDNFISTLKTHEIECLIDIREIPLSRKPGFSKTALRNLLSNNGIEYRHYRLMGSPRPLRKEVRETGNYLRFFNGVKRHLQKEDSQDEMNRLIHHARTELSCLMCCCADWENCHRKTVVEEITGLSYFSFQHISLNDFETPQRIAA